MTKIALSLGCLTLWSLASLFPIELLAVDPPCVTPPPGLVSWWAGQGNTIDSADANTGIPVGNLTYGTGKVGRAFVLDGTSDAVVVGNPTNLQLQNFTIETWIRRADPTLSSYGTHGDALLFGYGSGGYGLGLWDDGRLFLTRVDIDNVTIDNGISDTNFHHVAVTKADATVVFYIDGAAFPAAPYNPGFSFESVAAIGARADRMDDSFLGTIDEVAVYNRALTAAEIMGIYNAGSAGKCRTRTALAILEQPAGGSIEEGGTFGLAVKAVSDSPITYQWRLNGAAWAGQNKASLLLENVQTNQAGAYSVLLSDGVDTLLSSNAIVSVTPRLPCVPTAPGLVSWWQAESNTFDSFDANQGSLYGNAGYGPGRAGKAFRLDGNADAVGVGIHTNLQLQDFTIETWIKRDDSYMATLAFHGTTLFFGYGYGGYGFGMWNDGRLFLTRVGIDNVTVNTSLTDTNNFHHVAVTKLGTNVVFYIDGVAFPALPYDTVYTFGTQAAIGARGDTLDGSFLGSIDELAVYNRPLSAAEIQAIYSAGSAGKCKVPHPPVIVTQPVSRTNYFGDTVTFTVVASGDMPLSYQWRFQGTDLLGRTNTALILANVQSNNIGAYSVLVSNPVDTVLSSNAFLVLKPRPPCAPVPAGLVSWWRGETNMIDAFDSNDGVLTTPTQLYAPGKVGGAFSFGSFNRGASMVVADSESLRLTNALSIEAWVNPSQRSTSPQTILGKIRFQTGNIILGQGSYFLGLTNNGAPMFMLSPTGSLSTAKLLVASQPVPTNQWSFVVATYDGSAMRLYINGGLAAETNYSAGIFGGTLDIGIGGVPPGSFFLPTFNGLWGFSGLIDEVSLYNRALTPEEIMAVYASDITGKCLSPPSIAVQPQSQAVPLGEDVLFAPKVIGTRPFRFQWRFNGQNLFLATNATLIIEKVSSNRVGNYSVFITNSLGSTLSSNAFLSLLPAPSCTPLPNGVISWWPADNNGLDALGSNNLSGTFQVAFAVTGKVAQAFNIPRMVRGEPFIFANNSPTLNFRSNANFSIEAWIKTAPSNPPPTFSTIVDKRSVAVTGSVGYSLLLDHGRLAVWLGSAPASPTNGTTFTSPGPDLRDGMFHHVAVALNRTAANGGTLYVDGLPVLTFDPTARRGDLSNSSPFSIGFPISGITLVGSNFFVGQIDELALYNRALEPAEVMAIRQAGAAGKCKVKPFIITQPVSQRVNAGSNVTFFVSADGTPLLRYQWLRNGASAPDGTRSNLTFVAQTSLAGTYSVRVSNIFGSVLSSNAVLIVNTAPSALAANITLNEDTPTAITLHGADAQNDPLTFTVLTQPEHGTLTGIAPNLTYTPAQNFNGTDSFTFRVNDGSLDSAPATILLSIVPVNDAPTAVIQLGPLFTLTLSETNWLVLSLNNTNAEVVLDGSGSSDVENDPLSFSWFEGTNFLGAGMVLTNTFNISPHTITLQVSDGQASGIATAEFEVISTSDAVRDLYGMVQLSGLPLQTARPLQSTLKAAASALDNGNVTAGINVLQAFQNKVMAQVLPSDPGLAAELIAAAQEIIDALSGRPPESGLRPRG